MRRGNGSAKQSVTGATPGWFASVLLALLCVFTPRSPADAELVGHGGPVHAVAVSDDGETVLTAGFDYSVIHWDLAAEKALTLMYGHDAAVADVAFVRQTGVVVSGGNDGAVYLWRIGEAEPLRVLHRHDGNVSAVAVSPDGNLIASAGFDGMVRISPLTGDAAAIVLKGHVGPVNAILFAGDGERLFSAGYDGTIRLWTHASQAMEVFGEIGLPVNRLSLSPDGKTLVVAGTDEAVRLFDTETREERRFMLGHEAPVLSIAITPDGKRFATGGARGQIVFWSLADGKPLKTLRGHKGPVWSVAFTPGGGELLSAGRDGRVIRWDLDTGLQIGGRDVADEEPYVPPGDVLAKRGSELFGTCAVCHTLTPDGGNRAGPTLYGVFGRRVGTVAGYPYSKALLESDIVWSEDTIGALFEKGPQHVVPGTKMPLQRLRSSEDRRALLHFLRQALAFAERQAEQNKGE
ncbi:c-type cytochrome [Nisaea sp.]|uniref:c-type cytochrome n=1 Tax=Nisaea sp. TaxID=2024842 RepID=UPI003267F477